MLANARRKPRPKAVTLQFPKDAPSHLWTIKRSVLYQRMPKLFGDLALARGGGRYPRVLRALGGVQPLILDNWGLEPLDPQARHDLLEILEERYTRRSTIVTSQLPVEKWHDVIGDTLPSPRL